jgi:hypothetical protein
MKAPAGSPALSMKSVKEHTVLAIVTDRISLVRSRDYERLPETLAGLHILAFAILMLKNVAEVLA